MLETVNDSITNKKISAREPIQVLALLHYVFTLNNASVLSRIVETVNRGYPKVVDPFLTSTLPLAHRSVATAREVNQ